MPWPAPDRYRSSTSPADEYERVHDTGPRATFRLMQAIHPVMIKGGGGSIVNLGSAAGTGGTHSFGAYAGAKEAIRGMSKVAALEWGVDRIRVSVVCPLAETDGLKVLRDMAPKQYEAVVRSTSLKRIGDPHHRHRCCRRLPDRRRLRLSHRADTSRRRRGRFVPLAAIAAKPLVTLVGSNLPRKARANKEEDP